MRRERILGLLGLFVLGFNIGSNLSFAGDDPASRSIGQESSSVLEDVISITLLHPVHFASQDGSDLTAPPGAYRVEPARVALRLVPLDGKDALLVEANQGFHEVKVEVSIALSIPGTTQEEADIHIVQLLSPDGTSLEAVGTYSGVRPRGLFDVAKKAAAKAKVSAEAARREAEARAAATAKKAQQEAALRAQQAAQIALRAKQEAERLAQQARDEALRLAKLAAIGTCKAAVKADQMAGEIKKRVLQLAEARLAEIKKRFQAVDLINQAFAALDRQGNRALEKLTDSVPALNTPVNLPRLKKLVDPNYLCEGGFLTVGLDLHRMLAGTPAGGLFVGTRSAAPNPGGTLAVGYQYNQAAIVGVEGGYGVGFHVPTPSPAKGYIFAGGMISAGAGSSHAMQIAYWPGKEPEGLGMQITRPDIDDAPYWALGFSVEPREIPCLFHKFSTDKAGFMKALATGCKSSDNISPTGTTPIATPGNEPGQSQSSLKVAVDFVFNWAGQFQGFVVSPQVGFSNKLSSRLPGGMLASIAWQPGLTTTFP